MIDFATTQPPTADEFAARIALMLASWIAVLSFVEKTSERIAASFWNNPVPVDAASIPSRLPHPNPPGTAVPFDVRLGDATEDQKRAFVAFFHRDVVDQDGARGTGGGIGGSGSASMQEVANMAAEYKGALYQERAMKWIDDHFRLHLSNLKYPYVDRCW